MPDTNTLIQRWQGGDEHAAEALYNQQREATLRLEYGLLAIRPMPKKQLRMHWFMR